MNKIIKSIIKYLFFSLFLISIKIIPKSLMSLESQENLSVQKDFVQDEEQFNDTSDLISNIDEFINLPDGGTPWDVFGETGMNEYTFEDKEGYEWTGVRPEFSSEIKLLENKKILVQGYMFPLDLSDKQKTFLLLPFPISCPYHVHASSNLIIEVHAKKPVNYSYEAINLSGKLELVPDDDLYNIFFRLKEAKVVLN
ncbi:MAG: hypothetical protein CBC25_06275 [Pelagibacteraceae bacterium TMED65]|nr:hypothetical protein [Rickettsiales bacterium]OUU51027.1 MAG: hypothetical protein CBC25_06275 [Pelagibacteraceae bacterium TMED65]